MIKKMLIKLTVLSLLLAPLAGLAQPRPQPQPAPRPQASPRPMPQPAPHRRVCPPPVGPEWVAIGGIAYLTGTVIRACTEPPTRVVVYSQPQTVVVAPAQTIVAAPVTMVVSAPTQTVVVESAPSVVSKESLRADLISTMANSMANIPYSVSVDNFYYAGTNYGASISVVVSLGGRNYSITSGGQQPSYAALKAYLAGEIVNAVSRLSAQNTQTTTVVQIN